MTADSGSFRIRVYDEHRPKKLQRGAKTYIHGHSAGGTNPSLAEAMTAGMPVLAFDINYNRYTTVGQAMYWSDTVSLTRLIESSESTRLLANVAAMVDIAARSNRWASVSQQCREFLFPPKDE